MKFDAVLFAHAVDTYRGDRSLAVAAELSGVSPATLSRIERGTTPDLDTFAALCTWIGRTPNEFFGETPDEQQADRIVQIRALLEAALALV